MERAENQGLAYRRYSQDVRDNRTIQTSEEHKANIWEKLLVSLAYVLTIITFPLSFFCCIIICTEFERAVILRLGRLRKGGVRGPGIFFVIPCIDQFLKVDLRVSSFHIPPQEILTKDSVTIRIDAVIYYYIKDPLLAVIQVVNVHEATHLLSQTSLRNVAGTKMLMELLADKEGLSEALLKLLDRATEPWGVNVQRVEIKDVRLPTNLQRAMAAEAEALRMAKAKIAAAEGELVASGALKEAADVIAQNPVALQLRYLQTLNSIANDRNHIVTFPFPVHAMKALGSIFKK